MKGILKISTFFVLSLLINSLPLTAMDEQKVVWIRTLDGLLRFRQYQFGKDQFSHMKLIQKQITKGKGSKNDPVEVSISYDDFMFVLYRSNNLRVSMSNISVENLKLLYKCAQILEDYELMSRVNEVLIEKSGGVAA